MIILTISERIRFLRKEKLHLTQEALGEPLGLTRANIANIEAGRIAVTERVIISLCKEFKINEEWLRTGEGEMFVPLTRSEAIAEFAGSLMKEEDASFKKRLIEALAKLNEQEWEVLEGIAQKLTNSDQP